MSTLFAPSERVTRFSEDRVYRYELWRSWDDAKPFCCFIGLNPSTADETKDDPTIRKCIGFAKRWGYGALCMLNLFPLVATDPKDLFKAEHPIGRPPTIICGSTYNDFIIRLRVADSALTVLAWGTNVMHMPEPQTLPLLEHMGLTRKLRYLRLTKHGHPEHPLFLPYELLPKPWEGRNA